MFLTFTLHMHAHSINTIDRVTVMLCAINNKINAIIKTEKEEQSQLLPLPILLPHTKGSTIRKKPARQNLYTCKIKRKFMRKFLCYFNKLKFWYNLCLPMTE